MTNTGKHFLNIYEDKEYEEEINIKHSIKSVLIIFKKQIEELDIQINLDVNETFTIKTNKYLLANVFMIIIENSIKVFKKEKIKKPKLDIASYYNKVIQFSDNAGGIKITPIESIFEKDLTTTNSTGLGLYLAKTILSLKLNGNIEVTNQNDGACFSIIFGKK